MKNILFILLISVLTGAAFNVQAASAIDCSKKSLATELGKLDKDDPNEVNFFGTCNEDILIQDFVNLTLIGGVDAEIAGDVSLTIKGSNVRFESMTLTGTVDGAQCLERSKCVFEDVDIVCGSGAGIFAQNQSAVDVWGAVSISGCGFAGIAVFGASTVNVGKARDSSDPEDPAAMISSCGTAGAFVADGSFYRSDSATYVGNFVGVWGQRNATLKVFDGRISGVGIDASTGAGLVVINGTVAHAGLPITNTTGPAIELGPLSQVQPAFGYSLTGNATDGIVCLHPTAVPIGGVFCEP